MSKYLTRGCCSEVDADVVDADEEKRKGSLLEMVVVESNTDALEVVNKEEGAAEEEAEVVVKQRLKRYKKTKASPTMVFLWSSWLNLVLICCLLVFSCLLLHKNDKKERMDKILLIACS